MLFFVDESLKFIGFINMTASGELHESFPNTIWSLEQSSSQVVSRDLESIYQSHGNIISQIVNIDGDEWKLNTKLNLENGESTEVDTNITFH